MSRGRGLRNPEMCAWRSFSRELGRAINLSAKYKPVITLKQKREAALAAWLRLWTPSTHDTRFLQ